MQWDHHTLSGHQGRQRAGQTPSVPTGTSRPTVAGSWCWSPEARRLAHERDRGEGVDLGGVRVRDRRRLPGTLPRGLESLVGASSSGALFGGSPFVLGGSYLQISPCDDRCYAGDGTIRADAAGRFPRDQRGNCSPSAARRDLAWEVWGLRTVLRVGDLVQLIGAEPEGDQRRGAQAPLGCMGCSVPKQGRTLHQLGRRGPRASETRGHGCVGYLPPPSMRKTMSMTFARV
jgi:hypothetical protein